MYAVDVQDDGTVEICFQQSDGNAWGLYEIYTDNEIVGQLESRGCERANILKAITQSHKTTDWITVGVG